MGNTDRLRLVKRLSDACGDCIVACPDWADARRGDWRERFGMFFGTDHPSKVVLYGDRDCSGPLITRSTTCNDDARIVGNSGRRLSSQW